MDLFSLRGKSAVVVGGGGFLGATLAKGLSSAGAYVAVGDIDAQAAGRVAAEIVRAGGTAEAWPVDALSEQGMRSFCDAAIASRGVPDILVSAVGGNIKEATTSDATSFFDLPLSALERVVGLNLFAGAILPAQIFGKTMAAKPEGAAIINISSMTAFRPLTRIAGYSAAKAAVSNFTQWLAVHLAQNYGPRLRVNAIAPGFFLGEQNKYLLIDEAGELTPRGQQIIEQTPMGRFGEPGDLVGTLIWLASEASAFVTGIVVPVDGGFSAYSGI